MDASRKKFFVCTIVILALLIPMWSAFERPAGPMDEGSLLVYPELILKGELPYRDFETFYGPANLWVLSAAYAGFSSDIFVERAVGLAYRILIFVGIFVIVQRWSVTLATGCTLLAGVILLPTLLPAYAWLGGIMCALWSIWMILALESGRRCFLGGALAGLALLFRVDLGPAVIASALPLFLLMRSPRRQSYLAGAVVALLPLGWLTLVVSPVEAMNDLLLFPVIYSSPGRHLPIFSAENYLITLFLAYIVCAVINVIAGTMAVHANRRDPVARLLLCLAFFGLGLIHQAAQRIDFLHATSAAFLSIGTLPLSIFVLQSRLGVIVQRTRDAILATVCVLALLGVLVPELIFFARQQVITGLGGEAKKAFFVALHGRSFPLSSVQTAFALGKMLDRLDALASPGDRLFVGPADLRRANYNDTFIYYLLPRLRPSTHFLEMNPQSANRPNSRLSADIASADWLVLNHELDTWKEPNESTKFSSDAPMRVVDAQFELCGRYGPVDLYCRKQVGL
jgi:hypothetical protein